MFDTTVTIVGNALNAPELRRTTGTNTLVASFRVASTSRRYDKDNGRWVDGPSLRVRVTCWRRLAEGVAQSVVTGDPLVVTGRMYTRDWIGEDGQQRVSYELEAIAVGHDLSRGFAKFVRHRPAGSVSTVEDAEADARIAGEPTVSVSSPFSERFSEGSAERPTEPRPDGLASPFEPAMPDSYGEFNAAAPHAESPNAESPNAESPNAESPNADSPDDAGAAQTEDDALNALREAGIVGVPDVGAAEAEPATGPADGGAGGAGTDRDRPAGRRSRSRVPVPA